MNKLFNSLFKANEEKQIASKLEPGKKLLTKQLVFELIGNHIDNNEKMKLFLFVLFTEYSCPYSFDEIAALIDEQTVDGPFDMQKLLVLIKENVPECKFTIYGIVFFYLFLF